MSFKSWVKRATTIPKTGKGIVGNLLKNVSPFVPGGALASGLVAAAGEGIRRGGKANLDQLAKAGVSNAALSSGLKIGKGALQNARAAKQAAMTPLPAEPLSIPTGSLVQDTGMGHIGVGGQAGAAFTPANAGLVPPSGGGFLSGIGKGAARVGRFAEAHPTATGMALQGIGNIAGSDSENRLRNAQARRLEQQIGESDYDFRRRQANETAYDDLWAPIGSAIGTGLSKRSTNPYLPA